MFYFRLLDEEIQEIVEQGSLDEDEIFPSGEPNNYNIFIYSQASTLTQNDTGPVGPVTPSIYWSCKKFTGPTLFF